MTETRTLAAVAPRLARAIAQHNEHEMRSLRRCSCGFGWRVVGHEYDTNGCIDRLDAAKRVRDRFERLDAQEAQSATLEGQHQ